MTSTFERYAERLAAHRWAMDHHLSATVVTEVIRHIDEAVARVDGHGFGVTPFGPHPRLGSALAIESELWVKDESGNVSGSHKARHLFGVALQLELERRAGIVGTGPYAIASCGNAALAAAVVARAVDHPLKVFVPEWANEVVIARIEELGGDVVACPRRPGVPGDPSHHAMVEAIAEGAVPFSCQGTDTPGTIDGCRTLAWEIVDALSDTDDGRPRLDRLFVQVGGGALATAVLTGFAASPALDRLPVVHAVQPRGNHPLVRAWDRLVAELIEAEQPTGNPDRAEAAAAVGKMGDDQARRIVRRLAASGDRYMAPWDDEPESYATGILDDVTYDWIPIVEAMLRTGGHPVIAEEPDLRRAHALARTRTDIEVCPTGAAGLGGLVAALGDGSVTPAAGERIVVMFTGHSRAGDPVPAGAPS